MVLKNHNGLERKTLFYVPYEALWPYYWILVHF